MILDATAMPDVGDPESSVARDLIRRGLYAAPLIVAACGLAWGVDGAFSSAYALALVLANFALAAWLMSWSARISLAALMSAVLIGYVVRLGLVTIAVLLVSGSGWFEPVPLGITLVVSHLGLLLVETRYVSASLAFPGLKPRRPAAAGAASKESK